MISFVPYKQPAEEKSMNSSNWQRKRKSFSVNIRLRLQPSTLTDKKSAKKNRAVGW